MKHEKPKQCDPGFRVEERPKPTISEQAVAMNGPSVASGAARLGLAKLMEDLRRLPKAPDPGWQQFYLQVKDKERQITKTEALIAELER